MCNSSAVRNRLQRWCLGSAGVLIIQDSLSDRESAAGFAELGHRRDLELVLVDLQALNF
jgi:hypothetical protein